MLALSCALAISFIAHFAWRRTHAVLSSNAGHEDRPSRRDIKFMAVLPLDNLSGDPSQEYFADGMTDELITMLAKNSNRTSSPALPPCNTRERIVLCLR
jgi:hypothetical protein